MNLPLKRKVLKIKINIEINVSSLIVHCINKNKTNCISFDPYESFQFTGTKTQFTFMWSIYLIKVYLWSCKANPFIHSKSVVTDSFTLD